MMFGERFATTVPGHNIAEIVQSMQRDANAFSSPYIHMRQLRPLRNGR